jgi:hypothetical protein
MLGFRVFDVGLLVLWLVWFFRIREDSDPPDDGGGDDHGGGPPLDPPDPSGGGSLTLVLPGEVGQGRRLRDDAAREKRQRKRGADPSRKPSPARTRRAPRRTPVRS